MRYRGCEHDGRTWHPGYKYPLCRGCYDAEYRKWYEGVPA